MTMNYLAVCHCEMAIFTPIPHLWKQKLQKTE